MEASWQGIEDNVVHRSRPLMANNEATKDEKLILGPGQAESDKEASP